MCENNNDNHDELGPLNDEEMAILEKEHAESGKTTTPTDTETTE